MKKLFYLPLEPYAERYTALMSKKDGWTETWFKKFNINFIRIDGNSLSGSGTIKAGVVLDACGRNYYAMSQLNKLIEMINNGEVGNDDVIYTEDFWHPGIESLFYIRHLMGLSFKIGTFIHAQSVDDTDFAWDMKEWMRPIETGFGNQYDFIFTCSDILRRLCIEAGIARENNIFTVGLPYNSEELLKQTQKMNVCGDKVENTVLFCSRFDKEKDPHFFLDLCEECPEVNFILVNPRKNRSISNDETVVGRLKNNKPKNLTIVDTSNKKDYYQLLKTSKIVFNCAHQDWVSWTLLEAITFECIPLYPIWKDFPVELKNNSKYLYQKRNLKDAKEHLMNLLKTDFNSEELDYVVKKHDNSWKRYLEIMGF